MKTILLLSLLGPLSAFADIKLGDQLRLDHWPKTIGEVVYVSEDLVSLKMNEEASHYNEIVYLDANSSIFSKLNLQTLNIVCKGFGQGEGVKSKSSVKRAPDSGKRVFDIITCLRTP